MTKDERNLFETMIQQNGVLIAAVNRLNEALTANPSEQEWADGKPMGEISRLILAVERQEAAFEADRKLRLSIIQRDEDRMNDRGPLDKIIAIQTIRGVIELAIFAALVWMIIGLYN